MIWILHQGNGNTVEMANDLEAFQQLGEVYCAQVRKPIYPLWVGSSPASLLIASDTSADVCYSFGVS